MKVDSEEPLAKPVHTLTPYTFDIGVLFEQQEHAAHRYVLYLPLVEENQVPKERSWQTSLKPTHCFESLVS